LPPRPRLPTPPDQSTLCVGVFTSSACSSSGERPAIRARLSARHPLGCQLVIWSSPRAVLSSGLPSSQMQLLRARAPPPPSCPSAHMPPPPGTSSADAISVEMPSPKCAVRRRVEVEVAPATAGSIRRSRRWTPRNGRHRRRCPCPPAARMPDPLSGQRWGSSCPRRQCLVRA